MASVALAKWQGARATELDGLEVVHKAIRDAGEQRTATGQQVNRAFAMLLSSQFQGFCRDLHTGAIGHDFNGLGMAFWELVDAADSRNRRRRDLLDELNRWRNAIAHQDLDAAGLGGRTTVTLGMIRSWRSACDMLAVSFDLVVGGYAATITNTVPW